MATRIVFVGGTYIEVDTPIQNLVRLFEEATRSGLSFASAVDASMRYFVNREQIIYLEAIPDSEGKPFWAHGTAHGTEHEQRPPDLSGLSGSPPTPRTRRSKAQERPLDLSGFSGSPRRRRSRRS